MDTQLLRTFVVVSQTGSVTQAAEDLGYSQPGLTRQLRTLERHLGCTLFVRGTRPLTLTQAGRHRLLLADGPTDATA
jgi:DNA-binding transcriptional LysR family regulator